MADSAANSAYVAFLTSERLKENALVLAHNLNTGAAGPQAELLVEVVDDLTREILQAFMLDLVDLLHLPSLVSRLIHGTVHTISGTAGNLIRTVAKKLDQRQMQLMANYVRGLLLRAPDLPNLDGAPGYWLGFPIEEAWHRRVRAVIDGLRGDNPRAQVAELVAFLGLVTDRSVEVFMIEPAELLQLGFILRKLIDGGAAVIRGASHTLVRRMIPDLDAEQLVAMADHLEHMLLVNPAGDIQA